MFRNVRKREDTQVLLVTSTCIPGMSVEDREDVCKFAAKVQKYFGFESVAVVKTPAEAKLKIDIAASHGNPFTHVIAVYDPSLDNELKDLFGVTDAMKVLGIWCSKPLPFDGDEDRVSHDEILCICQVIKDEDLNQALRNVFSVETEAEVPTGVYALKTEETVPLAAAFAKTPL